MLEEVPSNDSNPLANIHYETSPCVGSDSDSDGAYAVPSEGRVSAYESLLTRRNPSLSRSEVRERARARIERMEESYETLESADDAAGRAKPQQLVQAEKPAPVDWAGFATGPRRELEQGVPALEKAPAHEPEPPPVQPPPPQNPPQVGYWELHSILDLPILNTALQLPGPKAPIGPHKCIIDPNAGKIRLPSDLVMPVAARAYLYESPATDTA